MARNTFSKTQNEALKLGMSLYRNHRFRSPCYQTLPDFIAWAESQIPAGTNPSDFTVTADRVWEYGEEEVSIFLVASVFKTDDELNVEIEAKRDELIANARRDDDKDRIALRRLAEKYPDELSRLVKVGDF